METDKSTYSNNPGFNVPEDYFRNFDEKLMNRLDERKMGLQKRNTGFSIPEDYFNLLEDKVIQKSLENETKVVRLFKKEYYFYAAAVAAIFILMLGNFFKTDQEQTLGWDDIEISAMENYIDDGYEMGYIDLNSSEYSDYIFEDGKLIDDSDFSSVNSEAAFEYLDENIEDPSYILE